MKGCLLYFLSGMISCFEGNTMQCRLRSKCSFGMKGQSQNGERDGGAMENL